MRNPLLPILIAVTAAASPALAAKVTLEYARDADYSAISSYDIADPGRLDGAPDRLVHDRIRHAVIRELWQAGLRSTLTDPDIVVTVRLVGDEPETISLADLGADGFGPGWSSWKGGSATRAGTAESYAPGTLIIAAVNEEDDRLIWWCLGRISPDAKPEKQGRQVYKIVSKLGRRWARILSGTQRQRDEP